MTDIIKNNRIFLLLTLVWLIAGCVVMLSFDTLGLHVALNAVHTQILDLAMQTITWMASGWSVVVVVLLMLLINVRCAIVTASSGIVSGLLAQLLKRFVFAGSMRPSYYFDKMPELNVVQGIDFYSQFSFPSGHATTAFVLMFSVSMLSRSIIVRILCFIAALVMAYSRIYLSQHFFADVYAGSVLGVLVVLICAVLVFKFVPDGWSKSIFRLCSKAS